MMDEFEIDETGDLEVVLASKIVDFKVALNALSSDGQCPCCLDEWSKLEEPSIAVILTCRHAYCAKCLYQQTSKDQGPEEESDSFKCCLCRKPISPQIFEEICQIIFKNNVIPSFGKRTKHLPFSKEIAEKTIMDLLMKNEFDVNKVDKLLFNMIGLFSSELAFNQDKDLNPKEKNQYYEQARRPVEVLEQEYLELRQELFDDNNIDNDSKEWKLKYKQLKLILEKLEMARQNAASDIFERLNSRGNMGILIDDDENEIQIDLHGLHINEAKWIIDDRILPILPVFIKLILITGHGLHSESGDSVLKKAVKAHLIERNIKVEQVSKNNGALRILYK